jgi:PEP-CTERM motif-containing protein
MTHIAKLLLSFAFLVVGLTAVVRADTVIIDQANAFFPPDLQLNVTAMTGQEFTPALSSLNLVRLRFGDLHPGNGVGPTLFVNIREGSISGPIIGSSNGFTFSDNFNFNLNTGVIVEFPFPTAVALTPGNLYVIEFVVTGEEVFSTGMLLDRYHAGRAIIGGVPSPDVDFIFIEGVQVPSPPIPEPGTLLLLGTGLVGVAARILRRKPIV